MNMFQLSCFLAVAETLNFARAAEQLNITQPAMTHQIRSLESELNVKLFKRTTRIVELTPAGFLFLNDARKMLEISAQAKQRFADLSNIEMQTLAIGCHNHIQLFRLPNVLKELARRYPHVYPKLIVVPFQHLFRFLEDETVDIIIGFREPATEKNNVSFKELYQIPMVCVCAASHPLASRSSIRPSDLDHEKLILLNPPTTQLHNNVTRRRPPSDFYFCESLEAVAVLVEAEFGVAVLPDDSTPRTPGLVSIPMEDMPPLPFGLYYKDLKGNTLLRDFVSIMESGFQERLPSAGGTGQLLLP